MIPRPGQICVYMLQCRDGSLYTGWTNDFARRIQSHRAGKGSKYTRSRLPVKPVYAEILPDKSSALRRERAIKKMSPAKKRALLRSEENILSRPGCSDPAGGKGTPGRS